MLVFSVATTAAGPRTVILAGVIGGVAILPAIGYIVTSVFLRKRRPWAIVVGLVIASLHELVAVLGLVQSAVAFGLGRGSPVGLVVLILWVAALAQLITQLSQSFAAMRADPLGQPRGFEVMPVVPVQE